MTFELGWPQISLGVILFGILQFLLTLWISERFKASLQRENAVFLENFRWEQKVREQAKLVAEYMAIVWDIKESDPSGDYRKSNQLSWELAMWLPEDIYRAMGIALTRRDEKNNICSVIVAVRKVLLGKSAGNLTQDDIIFQKPGIGKQMTNKENQK